ncbi:hypothetical protein J6590_016486 [Homalodisca vitripennis]|nr:hypothetical protein J6590_016486 [Homalodisca vitripennis]
MSPFRGYGKSSDAAMCPMLHCRRRSSHGSLLNYNFGQLSLQLKIYNANPNFFKSRWKKNEQRKLEISEDSVTGEDQRRGGGVWEWRWRHVTGWHPSLPVAGFPWKSGALMCDRTSLIPAPSRPARLSRTYDHWTVTPCHYLHLASVCYCSSNYIVQ